MTESARLFSKQYQHTQETKRSIVSTTPITLGHSTKDIAAGIVDECAVTPKSLRGSVFLKANKIIRDLKQNVVAVQAKVNKQERG